jgi:hypothetical protein
LFYGVKELEKVNMSNYRSNRSVRIARVACFLALFLGFTSAVRIAAADPVPFPASQRVDLLYLLSKPYSRLYIQVDAVEGCQPDEKTIATIRSVLTKYCDKPDGIQIVRQNIIPRSSVRGLAETVVAIQHMRAPVSSPGQSPPAYLYLLFYDSRDLGSSVTRTPRAPYVPTDYPCAVFVDRSYMHPHEKRLMPRLLTHELLHVLGLVKMTPRNDENHCPNSSCLMYCSYSLSDCLFRGADVKYGLCEGCKQDLREAQAHEPNRRMSFQGPILVRRESGYWVGLLPSYVGLYFRPIRSQDLPSILQAARNSGHRVKCIENSIICYDLKTFTKPANTGFPKNQVLDEAFEDPNPNVERAARTLADNLQNQTRPRGNM